MGHKSGVTGNAEEHFENVAKFSGKIVRSEHNELTVCMLPCRLQISHSRLPYLGNKYSDI
jgi:hypothetical protein